MAQVGSTKSEFRNSKQIQTDERQTHQMLQTGGDQIRGLENSNSSGFTFDFKFVSNFDIRILDLPFGVCFGFRASDFAFAKMFCAKRATVAKEIQPEEPLKSYLCDLATWREKIRAG